MFRVMKGVDTIDMVKMFLQNKRATRGHKYNLTEPRFLKDIKNHTLSGEVVNTPSHEFKSWLE